MTEGHSPFRPQLCLFCRALRRVEGEPGEGQCGPRGN